jgi:hypothetical protein
MSGTRGGGGGREMKGVVLLEAEGEFGGGRSGGRRCRSVVGCLLGSGIGLYDVRGVVRLGEGGSITRFGRDGVAYSRNGGFRVVMAGWPFAVDVTVSLGGMTSVDRREERLLGTDFESDIDEPGSKADVN